MTHSFWRLSQIPFSTHGLERNERRHAKMQDPQMSKSTIDKNTERASYNCTAFRDQYAFLKNVIILVHVCNRVQNVKYVTCQFAEYAA